MKNYTPSYLTALGRALFVACGAPEDEAGIVADELVEANLMGLDSHGVIRYSSYTDDVAQARICPGAPIEICKETATTAMVDFHQNFGPVGAVRMTEIAYEKARATGLSCVTSLRSHHVSRLGSYPQRLAERGMFCFGVASGLKTTHWVTPWGGREGRLATNPLAYAAPGTPFPIVMDMSTSMIAEGKIRALMHQGQTVPPNCVLDASGYPTTDPKAFYGPPMGTILPFGSELGYKGFGLGLLVEILGRALAGEPLTDEYRFVNGFTLITIDPEAFCGRETFGRLMEELSFYMTNTPPAPGFERVVMPGTYDFEMKERRLAEGIPVADETMRLIFEAAERWNATLPTE